MEPYHCAPRLAAYAAGDEVGRWARLESRSLTGEADLLADAPRPAGAVPRRAALAAFEPLLTWVIAACDQTCGL